MAPHETREVWVIADVDLGIAEMVEYLQTIPGVRTSASCQGTLGEGGPNPYRAQVMAYWPATQAARLFREFDVTVLGDNWGYLQPRDGWQAPQSTKVADALGAWLSAALDDPAVCDSMKDDIRAWFEAGQPLATPPADDGGGPTLTETVAELQKIGATVDWGPDPIGDIIRERHHQAAADLVKSEMTTLTEGR